MRVLTAFVGKFSAALLPMFIAGAGSVLAEPADDTSWARVTESEYNVKVETDQLAAVIPKKKDSAKSWEFHMTGIEKGSFLDKKTGFREAGDGLLVVDWIMEPGTLTGSGPATSRATLGPRDRRRNEDQDRDRQAGSSDSQEGPQALDDRHREEFSAR